MTQVRNSLVALLLLLGFVAVIWGMFLVNWLLLDGELNRQGIQPIALPYEFVSVVREIGNISFSPSYIWGVLQGILMSPLLHSGFGHIWSNTLPLLILGRLGGTARRQNAHRRVDIRGAARRDAGVAVRAAGGAHRRERACLRILRLSGRARLVQAQHRNCLRRRAGAASVRRQHILRSAAVGRLRIVGRAPVRANSRRTGGDVEQKG